MGDGEPIQARRVEPGLIINVIIVNISHDHHNDCHDYDHSDNVFCHQVMEELSARLRLGWRGEIDTTD